MPDSIYDTEEDISFYPHNIVSPHQIIGKNIVIGDMHGNCMKLIFTLIRYGVMHLPEPTFNYQCLAGIYSQPTDTIEPRDLINFKKTAQNSTIHSSCYTHVTGR
jgi:hypothetical protein